MVPGRLPAVQRRFSRFRATAIWKLSFLRSTAVGRFLRVPSYGVDYLTTLGEFWVGGMEDFC